ncbi:hypothetical protein EC973_006932, partial [Apophysomyces ossiformis]
MAACAQAFYAELYILETVDSNAVQSIVSNILSASRLSVEDQEHLTQAWTEDEISQGLSRTPPWSSLSID